MYSKLSGLFVYSKLVHTYSNRRYPSAAYPECLAQSRLRFLEACSCYPSAFALSQKNAENSSDEEIVLGEGSSIMAAADSSAGDSNQDGVGADSSTLRFTLSNTRTGGGAKTVLSLTPHAAATKTMTSQNDSRTVICRSLSSTCV